MEQTKVGVGTFVVREAADLDDIGMKPNPYGFEFLIGKRLSKDNHGNGQWCLPGGGLDYKEDPLKCARREVLEETGLKVKCLESLDLWTSDLFPKSNKGQHYITLFFAARTINWGDEPKIMEPEKCSEWRWVNFDTCPKKLFNPLSKLVKSEEVREKLKNYIFNVDRHRKENEVKRAKETKSYEKICEENRMFFQKEETKNALKKSCEMVFMVPSDTGETFEEVPPMSLEDALKLGTLARQNRWTEEYLKEKNKGKK